ncbi:MAG: outer membrane beta-barrel protein [Cryomorphaceae bacterium]|nr:outer membrane beta-barrel protein [Cryomorphaceae bacterium]
MLHDFGSRLQLQTDLLFSIYNDRISYEVGQEIHPEHGFILDAEPRTTVAISEYQTLTIPVLVNYYLNDKNKWRMYISGGVKGHLFISSYYSQFIKGDTLETFDNNRVQVGVIGDSQHRTISLSAQMGFGFEHQKSKKSCLRIAPYFEYFVVNPYKNYPSYELMAAGVSFGLYWK